MKCKCESRMVAYKPIMRARNLAAVYKQWCSKNEKAGAVKSFLRLHGGKLLLAVAVLVVVFFVPIAQSPMYHKPARMEIYRYDQDITVALTRKDPAFHSIYRSLKRAGATYLYHVPAILFGEENFVQGSYRASLWYGLYDSHFNPSELNEWEEEWQDFIIVRAYYDETQTAPAFFGVREGHPYTELAFVLPGEQTPEENILYDGAPCVNYCGPRSTDGVNTWQAFSKWGMPKRAIRVIDNMKAD